MWIWCQSFSIRFGHENDMVRCLCQFCNEVTDTKAT
jgi:hypothetical protein